METIKVVKITEIKSNPNNPRVIKDDKFNKLVESIKSFPEMANVRPIVVNTDMIVLGGNMRLKAMKEAGWKDAPIQIVNWDEQKQKEFIVKDNVGYGEWDWVILANEWDAKELEDWGLNIPTFSSDIDLGNFFEENKELKEDKGKIILEYSIEESIRVKKELLKHGKTPEDAVYNLLGL
jgi:ParB-like chromosome segregation protein Spo0J